MTEQEIEIVKGHFAIWNERNSEIRHRKIQETYAPDVNIIDQLFTVHGRENVDEQIEGLHSHFPAYSFRLRKPIETHHNAARLFWQLGSEEQPDFNTGMDVFVVEDGLIKTLIVFIDPKE